MLSDIPETAVFYTFNTGYRNHILVYDVYKES